MTGPLWLLSPGGSRRGRCSVSSGSGLLKRLLFDDEVLGAFLDGAPDAFVIMREINSVGRNQISSRVADSITSSAT